MKRIALAIAAALVFVLPVSAAASQHAQSHAAHSQIDWD